MIQKKLRGAIIGYGFIASKGHMPAYLERIRIVNDVEIIAICDFCSERINDVPSYIPFFDCIKDLLENCGKNLDFVDIATHANDHFQIAKMCLEKGIHVLSEKPLTTKVQEAEELIATALAHNRILFPCHNYKYAPVIQEINRVINSGKIGKVHSVTLNTFRNTHAVGTKEWHPHWRRFKEFSGGGIAMDHGSHSLYLAFEWLKGYPKSVTAFAKNSAEDKYDTEDYFNATYEFEEGVVNIHLSWTAGTRKVIYAIQGSNGAITVDDDRMEVAVKHLLENENSSHKAQWSVETKTITSDWMDSSHSSWFNLMFDKFKYSIENQIILGDEIRDAYFCVKSILKSYESIQNDSIKVYMTNSLPNIL